MFRLPRFLAAGAVVAAVAAGAAFVLLSSDETPVSSDSDCPFSGDLRVAGFSPRFLEIVCSATTEVVPSDDGIYHFIQNLPALGLRRGIQIAIHPNQPFMMSDSPPVEAKSGAVSYPLHHSVHPFEGGYDRYLAFYLPYDGVHPWLLQELGLLRRGARLDATTHSIALSSAEPGGPGAVVSSVITTTQCCAPTAPALPGSAGGVLGKTVPRLADPQLDQARREVVQRAAPELRTSLTPQEQAAIRRFRETPAGKALTEAEQAFSREMESRRALRELRTYGETTEQAIERVLAERSRQSSQEALDRFTRALAALEAVGELTQAALDWWEHDDALDAAEDCHNNPTNPIAQNARANDRANYDRALDQIGESRGDNNWDTGVEVLNTANGLASSAIPGAPGLALGVWSSGNTAPLRELQQQRTRHAVAGVTPCTSGLTNAAQYIKATIAYTFSLHHQQDNRSLFNPNDLQIGDVTEVMNGSVKALIDSNGQFPERTGWGEYRRTESTSVDKCVKGVIRSSGPIALYLSGAHEGTERREVAPGQFRRVEIFTLTVNAQGEDVPVTSTSQGTEYPKGLPVCVVMSPETYKENPQVLCHFSGVALLEGGTFFDDDTYKDDGSDPNDVQSRSCRLDIAFSRTPPTPSAQPPPPLPGP